MEPQIRYVTSADGTHIAYAVVGSGPPLIVLLSCYTNLELEWKDPEGQAWLERLAEGRQLIRCERRGCGASQRDVTDLSLDAQVADVAAVANHLQLERFDLFAAYDGAAVAAAYCARYPQHVARLVLWAPFARGMDINDPESFSPIAQLMRSNWSLARRTWADLCFPSGPPQRVRWYNDLLRQTLTPEVAARYMEFMRDLALVSLLEQMQTSTLVLCRDRDRFVPAAVSRTVAALLPNAAFEPLEGDIGYPPFGDISYLDSVKRFLDEGRAPTGRSEVPSGTAIILFADIVDSTALTERLGDTAFRDKARELDSALRALIRDHSGTPIEGKLLGDGVLAVFTSARQAIETALACGRAGSDGGLPLHLGLHAGDVIREADPDGRSNVYGGAVNIASRISGLSAPGEVLVSRTVADLARTSAGVTFDDRGEHELKGVAGPQRVFAVQKEDA
ncbi:MAG: adenylate/guanylate cyclase domain-containing protein [Dehalococcoidia bacterium]